MSLITQQALMMSLSSGGGGAVSFVASTTAAIATSTTSQAHSIPGTAVAGDLAIAYVMHRDTLTLPAGWTLVKAQAVTAVGVTQTLSVCKKILVSGDIGTSFTWTQATAQRMIVHYQVFRKSGGCDVTASASVSNASINTITTPMPLASLSVPAGSTMVSSGITQVQVTGATGYSSSAVTIATPPAPTNDARLSDGYASASSGSSFSGLISTSGGAATNGYNGVTVSIG